MIAIASGLAVAVIIVRCVVIAAHLNRRAFKGHPFRFAALAVAFPLMAGGALSIWFDIERMHFILLVGVALLLISDRRAVKP